MEQEEKKALVEEIRKLLLNEPKYANEDINDLLMYWFTMEFFNGEITRKELDEYLSILNTVIQFDICDELDEITFQDC